MAGGGDAVEGATGLGWLGVCCIPGILLWSIPGMVEEGGTAEGVAGLGWFGLCCIPGMLLWSIPCMGV